MTQSMFGVELRLIVSGDVGDGRAAHFQSVVDEYAKIEAAHNDLLDVAFGYADIGNVSEVDVEVTVLSDSTKDACTLALSCVRAAIHAAGGETPNWEDGINPGLLGYRLASQEVEAVPA